MASPSRRSSAARRLASRPRSYSLLIVIAVGCVLLIGVMLTRRGAEQVPPSSGQAPTRRPMVAAAPHPTATVTPTSTPLVLSSGWSEAQVAPSPSPTRRPTATPRPSRPRTATPTVAECLTVTWSAGASAAAWGQVLVSIEVRNTCRRTIPASQVWFWVGGYRQGELVSSRRGHLFHDVTPTHSASTTIALPGSLDWMDRLEVRLLDDGQR